MRCLQIPAWSIGMGKKGTQREYGKGHQSCNSDYNNTIISPITSFKSTRILNASSNCSKVLVEIARSSSSLPVFISGSQIIR